MKTLFCFVIILIASGCATGDYAQSKDIEELRQEIAALRAEVQELKKAAVISQPRSIELPITAVKPLEAAIEYLVISVTNDGQIYLADKAVTPDELKQELRSKVPKDPKIRVVLRAGKEVPYQKIVELMDLAKSSGVQNLSIATTN